MIMEKKEFYSFDDIKDKYIGEKGTSCREAYEQEVSDAVQAYKIGEAIKNARTQMHLTQEELGEKVGVKKSQISRLENGHSITIPTMSRIFKALGVRTAILDLGRPGTVALW